MDVVPSRRIRTINEDLKVETINMDCFAYPTIDWEEQNNRWKALLLLKITG